MSSPLDGRIRKLAREEAASMLATPATTADSDVNTDRAAELQQQITDLHEHLHHAATVLERLGDRLGVLENAAGQTDPQQRPTGRRTARKGAGE